MAERKVKARYKTVGPKLERVTYTKAHRDESLGLITEEITEEMQVWYVHFPQGHITRFCGPQGLKDMQRLGFDKRPRLIDMETGDVVDVGGDPYDFTDTVEDDGSIALLPEDDNDSGIPSRKSRSTKQTAEADA